MYELLLTVLMNDLFLVSATSFLNLEGDLEGSSSLPGPIFLV